MPASKLNEYIAKCEEKYPGLFDYSKTELDYKGCNSKVTIVCKLHNEEFEQSMYILLKFCRNNCTKCKQITGSNEQTEMQDNFIRKVVEVFPDLKINFSKLKYVSSDKPIILICEEHGEFKIIPNRFLSSRYGCQKCGIDHPNYRKIKGILVKNGSNKKDFIKKSRVVHGDKYDYSSVVYKGNKKDVKIKCPDHGIFEQSPDGHINGKQGCKKCAREYNVERNTWTVEQFIEKATEIHGERYDYSKVKYKKYDIKVTISCRIHGDFPQKPNNHIDNQQGCPTCGHQSRILNLSDTVDDFIEKAKLTHGDRYDYSNVIYIDSDTYVNIVCKKHGKFPQRPANHIFGQGCPACKESKGENKIAKYLDRLEIKYVRQKTFAGCINKSRLKFDFYVPSWNCCIEYDGEQHFKSVEYFGGHDTFINTQVNDNIKDEYCVDNDIHLIRIPFNVENIEEYIDTYHRRFRKARKIFDGEFYESYKLLLKLQYKLFRLELIVKNCQKNLDKYNNLNE